MATNKVIGFSIEVVGDERIIKTLEQLKAEIKSTEAEFSKAEFGSQKYKELEQTLGVLKTKQADLRAEQKKTQTEFAATKFDLGSYRALSAELNKLRNDYKDLSEADRNGTVGQQLVKNIQVLDEKLKGIDAEIGQFQRNVGDYENAVTRAFAKIGDKGEVEKRFKNLQKEAKEANNEAAKLGDAVKKARKEADPNLAAIEKSFVEATDKAEKLNKEAGKLGEEFPTNAKIFKSSITGLIPGLDDAIQQFEGLATASGFAGKAMAGAFIGFAAAGAAFAGIQAIGEITKEFTKLRTEATALTDATGKELDKLAVDVKTTADVFQTDYVDVLRATNALSKNFNITLEESSRLIEEFQLAGGLITDDSIKQVEEYSSVLGDANIKAEDLLTIIALSAKSGQFNDFGVDAFKEFSIRLNTDGKKIAAALKEIERQTGTVFADKLVNDVEKGAIGTTEALTVITKELEKLPIKSQPVKKALSEIFGSKGEDVSAGFLTQLSKVGSGLDSLIDKDNKYIIGLREQIRVTAELNEAKNELTKRFEGLVASTTNATTQIQTGLIKVLVYLYDSLAPITAGLFDMIKGLYEVAKAAPIIEKPIMFLVQAFAAFFDGLKFIPAQMVAIDAVMQVLESRIDATWGKIIIKAEILAKKATSLITFNPDTKAALAKDITLLEDKLKVIDRFAAEKGKTLGDIYTETLKEQYKKVEEFTKKPITAPPIKPSKAPNQLGETAAAAVKKETEALKKEQDKQVEQQAKAREDALKAEQDFADKKRQILLDLNREIIAEQLAIMADGKAKELQAEQNRTDAVAAAQKERLNAYQKSLKEAADKIKTDLGKDSNEYKNFVEQSQKDVAEVTAQSNLLLETEAEQHRQNIQEIDTKYNNSDYKALLEQQARELNAIDEAYKLQELQLAEQRAKAETGQSPDAAAKIGVTLDTKEYDLQKAKLLEKVATLDKELYDLQSQAPSNPLISDADIDAVVLAKQQLNTELAELEKRQTETVQNQAQERAAAREQEYQQAGQIALAALDFIGQLAQQQDEAEQQQIEKRLSAKEQEIATIEEKLQTASGLQKEALQNQLDEELAAQKAIEKEQADLERKAAKRQKAISIIQSLINTALAISGALAAPPFFPLNTPSVITAGVLGAIQTAAIIAQPLATGGVVKGVPNIAQLPNGDNVFTTLRIGEVVMNEAQQTTLRAIAGGDIFSRIKIPGFAAGGVVGGTSAIPTNLPYTTTAAADNNLSVFAAQTEAAILALDRKTDAIYNSVVTLKVGLDTDELTAVQGEEARLRKKATL
jgi:hypothetical protein